MPIPDYQTIMLPLLQLTADKKIHSLRESIEKLAEVFNLSDAEKQELLPSGKQAIFNNRVSWSKTYLLKAGLLVTTKKSFFQITERGLKLLETNPPNINTGTLSKYAEYREFVMPTGLENQDNGSTESVISTPEEALENSYQKIRKTLAQDVLNQVKKSSPAFFEKCVVELLVRMGYGGSLKDAGKATRLTGDEGIDGTIKEDKLGLDFIYIQAKRWTNTSVGRPDIQSFVGALEGQRANKGIFITTSTFANTAVDYVKTISKKVILIDGQQLAEYMIDYNIGVSTIQTFELKRIDNDYFDE